MSHFFRVTAIPHDKDWGREQLLINSDYVRFIQPDQDSHGSTLIFSGGGQMVVVEDVQALWTSLSQTNPEHFLNTRFEDLEDTLSEWIGDLGERVDRLTSRRPGPVR